MKNLFTLGFLALAFSLTVAACGEKKGDATDSLATDSTVADTTMMAPDTSVKDTTKLDTTVAVDTTKKM